jgi:hypothetical protein
MSGTRWLLVAVLGCILVPQLIGSLTLPAILTNDSVWYLDQTHTWDSPRPTDYYAAGGKPVEYELTYPPGYPLFLDFCHLFVSTWNWARAVVGAQHVLSFLTAILIYGIGRRLGHPLAGCVAAALYGLHLPRVLYAQALMSETLFAFLLVLGVRLSLASVVAGAAVSAAAGLVFAGAALTKFQGVAGIPLVLLIYWRVRAKPVKAWAFLASAGFVMALALLHNLAFYGQARLTTFTGKHLADRVFAGDGLVDRNDPDTRYILERISASGIPHVFPGPWCWFARALRSDGSSPLQADQRILRAALAAIRTDPWRYAKNTASNLFANVFFEDDLDPKWFWTRGSFATYLEHWAKPGPAIYPPLEAQARSRVLKAIEAYPPPLHLGSAGLGWIRLFDSPWLKWRGMAAWFLVGGLLCALTFGTTESVFLAALILAVSLPGALFEFEVARYFEPLVPLALLAACVALPAPLFERRAGPWLLLAAAFLGIAAAGHGFKPALQSLLWPARAAALVISAAGFWISLQAAREDPRPSAGRGVQRCTRLGRPAVALALLLASVVAAL